MEGTDQNGINKFMDSFGNSLKDKAINEIIT
jgi:hypothetical protein